MMVSSSRYLSIILLLNSFDPIYSFSIRSPNNNNAVLQKKTGYSNNNVFPLRASSTTTLMAQEGKEKVESILTTLKTINSPQILAFEDPTTKVPVILIGAMHYNPVSIQLTNDIVEELGSKDQLGSVVIESCDLRFNQTRELYKEKPILKSILSNEMKKGYEIACSYNRPVVLGDQRVNITTSAMKGSMKQTAIDLVTPVSGGWNQLGSEIKQATKDTQFFGGEGYLNAFAFLDPRLLLGLPITFVKYPLSFAVRYPLRFSIFFSSFLLLSAVDPTGASGGAADYISTQGDMISEYTLSSWFTSLSISAVETIVFARLLLKPMLADRNTILAQNILDQCKLYETTKSSSSGKNNSGKNNWWTQLFNNGKGALSSSASKNSNDNSNIGIVYAPPPEEDSFENALASAELTKGNNQNQEKAVVAVLGMAHLNGIRKILQEQLVV